MLKVYIDSSTGVSIDDCERVSRQISSLLDVEDVIADQYVLEVSSPGADRKFFNASQYQAFAGATIKIKLRSPFEGRRKFTGFLCGTEGDEVVVRLDEEELMLPLEQIEHANVVPDF